MERAEGGLGYLFLNQEEYGKARETFSKALEIAREIKDRSGEIEWSYFLGYLYDRVHDQSAIAYDFYRRSIDLIEEQRGRLSSEEHRISFAVAKITPYEYIVSLCIRMGKIKEAFQYVERAKSKALIDLLSQQIDQIQRRPYSVEEIKQINTLNQRLVWLRKRLNQLYETTDEEHRNEKKFRNVLRWKDKEELIWEDLQNTEKEYRQACEDLKLKDPEFSSFVNVTPLSFEEIQGILDAESVLLEYYRSAEGLIIFVVKSDGDLTIQKVDLDIEFEVKNLLQLMEDIEGGTGMDPKSHDFLRKIKHPLQYFYDLLIRPILKEINTARRLIIIPHLFWHYLPFHALYDKEQKNYLIDQFEICYSPSATVLSLCQKKNPGHREKAVILANPTGDLPFADEEADKIATAFMPYAKVFREKEANYQIMSELGCQADVLHLACHGVFRGDDPLFSHLVLSGSGKVKSRCFMMDIFNLKLQASLVTLSACETGLNQVSSGDELIGLARGFFYAGTPSLIVSLWQVNDQSTATLMENFYWHFARNRTTKTQALQLAIQSTKCQEEYSHPYFWAPFLLMGDWR
jgi:CHAT domain-containing protein